MIELAPDQEIYLFHSGVKGMKWGVRKVQQPLTTTQKMLAHPFVKLAKGTKEGNAANLAVTAASIAALAVAAPISTPILVGGVISSRVAIKSYDAYKLFYEKHPSKILPSPKASTQAKLRVGQDIKKELLKTHGSTKMSKIKTP